MLGLILALSLSAAPSQRLSYEQKCLYCHSEEVTESRRYSEAQWRRLIEQMRRKAPLLITRSDVFSLTRYMTQTLKLVPNRPPPPPARVSAPEVKPVAVEPLPPEPVVESGPAAAPAEELPASDTELEQTAFAVMQQRCSKCHTLGRVYSRLDSFERSMSTLERMRLKTGSGITDREMKLLEEYLRSQFKQPAD
jgi:mono/diheme cytochrome c family protein